MKRQIVLYKNNKCSKSIKNFSVLAETKMSYDQFSSVQFFVASSQEVIFFVRRLLFWVFNIFFGICKSV